MSKHILIFFVGLLLLSTNVLGQIWNIDDRSIFIKSTPEEDYIIGCAELYNKTSDTVEVMWERSKESFTNKDWESYVVDDEIEWAPFVDTGTFELLPKDTLQLCVNLLSYHTSGRGTVILHLYADADSVNVQDSIVYKIDVDWPSATKKSKQIRLYPNAAQDHIHIDWNNFEEKIQQVDIYNLIGMKVATHKVKDMNEVFSIELEDLDSGVYFISMLNQSKKLVFTKTFSKVD